MIITLCGCSSSKSGLNSIRSKRWLEEPATGRWTKRYCWGENNWF